MKNILSKLMVTTILLGITGQMSLADDDMAPSPEPTDKATACWSCKFDTSCGTVPLVGSTCPEGGTTAGVRWTTGTCPDFSLVATADAVRTLNLSDLLAQQDPNCQVSEDEGENEKSEP
jgi:hypothetical protein